MRSLARLFFLVIAAVPLVGCYFVQSRTRPLQALAFAREAGARQPCLVIFVPGMLDGPDTYREHGFPRAVVDSGARCDSVAVNLHFGYYETPGVATILHEDVLAPAIARGYTEIWVVGISMGGLGASLLVREHPELVRGLILLSPFLGDERTIASIADAGGLATWHPPEDLDERMTESTYTTHLWSFFRGYVDDPDGMPELYLGYANGERLSPGAQVLGAVLPEGHAQSIDGGHNWSTWRPLFEQFVTMARVGRRGEAIARAE